MATTPTNNDNDDGEQTVRLHFLAYIANIFHHYSFFS
jgi:hypothetical protein